MNKPAAQTKEQIEADLEARENAAINELAIDLFQRAGARMPDRPGAQCVAMMSCLANLMGNAVNLTPDDVTGMVEDMKEQLETRFRTIVTIRSNLEAARASAATKQ